MESAGEIHLLSGRRIYLQELRQYETYEGLIEGLPTEERNTYRLDHLAEEYRGKPYPGEPYLIQPKETPLEYRGDKQYPFGTPSALPAVTCIGRFTSHDPVRRGTRCDYSGLIVIWFQPDFAFPIEESVFAEIQAIDWDRHAIDMEY